MLEKARRAVRALRERLAIGALRRLYRVSHRLPVRLRELEPRRVLVVAPHMDDEIIGAGGALIRHRALGSTIEVAFCAKGADPEIDRVRRAEAEAVAQRLGFSRLHFLGAPDGSLTLWENELADQLEARIRAFSPDAVFCPFPADHHRDHAAAALATGVALRRTAFRGEVWTYEVWSPLWPNVAIDISRVADAKRDALALYVSQVTSLHYVDGILGLNRYRGLRVYVDSAEAYYVTSTSGFWRLCSAMNTIEDGLPAHQPPATDLVTSS